MNKIPYVSGKISPWDLKGIDKGKPKPSLEIKQILIPIDFSEASKRALSFAAPLADQFDSFKTGFPFTV